MYFYRYFTLFVLVLLTSISTYGCHKGVRPIDELEDIPRITKEELKSKMGEQSVNIIDVRYKPNWKKSDRLISGALREEPMEVGSWTHKYPKDRMIVLYCDWPNEQTSASVAFSLIERGYTNVYTLKGGWWEWVKAGYPTEPK